MATVNTLQGKATGRVDAPQATQPTPQPRDWGWALWLLGVIPIGLLLFAWYALARWGDVPAYLVPAPAEVLDTFINEWTRGRIQEHLGLSMRHYLMGLGWGIGLGVTLGLLTGYIRMVTYFVEPLVALFRPIPPLAWIPFAIIAIGINTQAAAFIIGIGAFYINFYNTLSGVRSVDPKLIEAARTLGENPFGMILRVIIPASIPSILTGIRISLGQGWMTVIAAEMFGIRGLGQRLMEAAGLLAMDVVICYMIVIGVLHLLMDQGFRLIQRFLLRWR